jgi:hypothetical protein
MLLIVWFVSGPSYWMVHRLVEVSPLSPVARMWFSLSLMAVALVSRVWGVSSSLLAAGICSFLTLCLRLEWVGSGLFRLFWVLLLHHFSGHGVAVALRLRSGLLVRCVFGHMYPLPRLDVGMGPSPLQEVCSRLPLLLVEVLLVCPLAVAFVVLSYCLGTAVLPLLLVWSAAAGVVALSGGPVYPAGLFVQLTFSMMMWVESDHFLVPSSRSHPLAIVLLGGRL